MNGVGSISQGIDIKTYWDAIVPLTLLPVSLSLSPHLQSEWADINMAVCAGCELKA